MRVEQFSYTVDNMQFGMKKHQHERDSYEIITQGYPLRSNRNDPSPMLPIEEQIENSSLFYEKSNKTWFLFTNHIGIEEGKEFTDAIWVYWSKDLNKWEPRNKAIVLDGENCTWSKKCIGLPSVVKVGNRLALFYDAPGGESTSHMKRHVGLAWLDFPLTIPDAKR